VNEPYHPPFRRSTFCGGGTCVEVAPLPDGQIAVRDSKNLNGRQHTFTQAEWAAFVQGVKAGEFDF
jgi:Domain of unknown function (DUF397)